MKNYSQLVEEYYNTKPSKYNFVIFRSDINHWLDGKKENDILPIDSCIAGSLDRDLVINENVKQLMIIKIKKGTPIIVPNNNYEKEVDIINTGDYKLKITDINKNNIPTYKMEVVR